MKNIYLLCVCTAINGFVIAQPVLTEANTAPVIGEIFTMSQIPWDGLAPGAGANQTWDFSALSPTSTYTFDLVDPSTCPSPGSFPTATVTNNAASGSQYEFLMVSSTAIERVGFYAGGYDIPYSDPEKQMSFPFTYLDSYVDPFGGDFTTSVTMTRAGDVTVTADAYGTLMLPNSTITNVLRVKYVQDYGDTYMGSELYHYNTEIYMFYKPGVHIPVLTLVHFEQGGTETEYGYFQDDATLETEAITTGEISVYPVPASGELFISWGTSAAAIQSVEVYNVLGEAVYQSNQAVNSIDITQFENGVYFIHFWDGEIRTTKKFIKN